MSLYFSAKEARSKFTLKDYSLARGVALYEAELLTSRTHQLRIQFSDAGAPVIADPYYNPMFVEFLRTGAARADAPHGVASPLEMGLQAHALQFAHPYHASEIVNLRLPMSQKWKAILNAPRILP
jgi:23S rRNA-/tRNA-specific pseudouridylate synthase